MAIQNYPHPQDCSDLHQIRVMIDSLDEEIISLFGKRFLYATSAYRFKSNEADIRGKDRVTAVLKRVNSSATAEGLKPEIMQQIYSIFIEYCIEEQLKYWNERKR